MITPLERTETSMRDLPEDNLTTMRTKREARDLLEAEKVKIDLLSEGVKTDLTEAEVAIMKAREAALEVRRIDLLSEAVKKGLIEVEVEAVRTDLFTVMGEDR